MTSHSHRFRCAAATLALAVLSAPLAAADERAPIEVAGATIHLDEARMPAIGARQTWTDWLRTGAESVASISGRFPLDEFRVWLQPTSRNSAIAFGRVKRREPPIIVFDVRPDASLTELEADWRGYHEMAHLLIPFPGNRDIWFTEGLASYYQYLLMARAGVISVEAAWRELALGFRRGLDDPAGAGTSLRRLSPRMWDEHAFKRVYWTGAAYFLRVDTRLRTETGGRLSVDHALAGFQRCCLRAPSRERWSAEALIEALGRFGRADIWRQEYERMIDAPARPDIGRAFERLGVRLEPDGRIGFDDREPAERLREAIALGDRQIKGSGSSPRPLDDHM
jgi:hypothetical protein